MGKAVSSRSVQAGVGVVIMRDGRVLLGQRVGPHGAGTWAFPGGHLEFGESPESCAAREAYEETGLHITSLRAGPYTSDVFTNEGKHYVTLFVLARSDDGTPEVREPEKCLRWQWFSWSELPEPLFPPVASLRRSGFNPENAA